jgi:hypothetical protein
VADVRENPFDGVYAAIFVLSAWGAANSVYWLDPVSLTFISAPFVGWTLWRGGFKGRSVRS